MIEKFWIQLQIALTTKNSLTNRSADPAKDQLHSALNLVDRPFIFTCAYKQLGGNPGSGTAPAEQLQA